MHTSRLNCFKKAYKASALCENFLWFLQHIQRWWTPFSTVPRKKSQRVRTIRKVDSDSETLHIEKDSREPRSSLERSCSVDALDDIGDDGEPRSRLRTKRASTQVESHRELIIVWLSVNLWVSMLCSVTHSCPTGTSTNSIQEGMHCWKESSLLKSTLQRTVFCTSQKMSRLVTVPWYALCIDVACSLSLGEQMIWVTICLLNKWPFNHGSSFISSYFLLLHSDGSTWFPS